MKTLSLVIPLYNEGQRLSKTFAELDSLQLPHELKLKEIIFVNDGSTDNTKRKINQYKSRTEKPVTLISYPENRGKGYAIRRGMLVATGDYTLFFDADMSTPLTEINKLLPCMQQGISVIVGTRKNGRSTVIVHQPLYREILGKGFTKFTRLVLQLPVTDFTCGFKAFGKAAKNSVFSESTIDRWGYDAEILYVAHRQNLSIIEVPVTWSDVPGTKVSVTKAILQTLFELIKIRLDHSMKPAFSAVLSTHVSGQTI